MDKSILTFGDVIFIRTEIQHNLPDISEDEKKKYYRMFEDKGWFNGELMSLEKYDKVNNFLKIYFGRSNFFDFLICHLTDQKTSPIISVNGVIETEDSLVLIKRGNEVSSYPNWWDFPAGMIHYKDKNLIDRLLERIKQDTNIASSDIFIEKKILFSTLLDNRALNFFYHLIYKKTKKDLETFFDNHFKKNRPIILHKSEIDNFLEKNKVVFSEILEKGKKNFRLN